MMEMVSQKREIDSRKLAFEELQLWFLQEENGLQQGKIALKSKKAMQKRLMRKWVPESIEAIVFSKSS